MASLPLDDLPAESSFRSFSGLFASPFCGPADLVEEWTDEDDVEDEGTLYDVASWELSNQSQSGASVLSLSCVRMSGTEHCRCRWRWNCDRPWRFSTYSQA